MAQEGGYAPRSPDLSAYHATPPQPPQATAQSPTAHYQPNPFPSYQPPPYNLNHSPQPPLLFPQHQHQPYPQGYLAPPIQYPPPLQPAISIPAPQDHMPSSDSGDPNYAPESAGGKGRGKKSKKLKVEEEQKPLCDKPAPGVEEGIDVRTKFPVARIKRIMQADEDVGKVAQVTPTAVSKALELFMISLVLSSVKQARGKSSKKVTASHLKQVIQQDSTFDFLAEIVSKVPDAPTKKENKDDDSDGMAEAKKRRGRSKRKADDSDLD